MNKHRLAFLTYAFFSTLLFIGSDAAAERREKRIQGFAPSYPVYAPYYAPTGCVGGGCPRQTTASGAVQVAPVPGETFAVSATSQQNPLPAQTFAPGFMQPIAPGLFIDRSTRKIFFDDNGHYRQVVLNGMNPVGLAGGVMTQRFLSAWNSGVPQVSAALGVSAPQPQLPPGTSPPPQPPPTTQPPGITITPANLKLVKGKDGKPLFDGKMFSDPNWMYWSPTGSPDNAKYFRYGGPQKGLELCASGANCEPASSLAGASLKKFYEDHYGAGIKNAPAIVKQFIAEWTERAPNEDAPAVPPTTIPPTTPNPPTPKVSPVATDKNCALFIGGVDNPYPGVDEGVALTTEEDGSRDMGRAIALPALGLKDKGYEIAVLADWGDRSDVKKFLAGKGIKVEKMGNSPEETVNRKLESMKSCKNIEIVVHAHGAQCACENDKMTPGRVGEPMRADDGKCDIGHYFATSHGTRFDSQNLITQIAKLEKNSNVNLAMASCHAGRLKGFAQKLQNTCVTFLSSGNSTGRMCGEHDPDYDPDYSSAGEAVLYRYYVDSLDKLSKEPYFATKKGSAADKYDKGPAHTVGNCFERVNNNLKQALAECKKYFGDASEKCKWDSVSNSFWMGHFLDRTPTEVSLSSFGTAGYFGRDNFGKTISDHESQLENIAKKKREMFQPVPPPFNGIPLSGAGFLALGAVAATDPEAKQHYDALGKSIGAYNAYVASQKGASQSTTDLAAIQKKIREESRKVIELERKLVRAIEKAKPGYFVKPGLKEDPCARKLPGAPKPTPPPVPPTGTNPPIPPTGTNPPIPPTGTNPPIPPTGTNPPIPPTGTNPPIPPTGTNPPVPPTGTNPPIPPTNPNPPIPPTVQPVEMNLQPTLRKIDPKIAEALHGDALAVDFPDAKAAQATFGEAIGKLNKALGFEKGQKTEVLINGTSKRAVSPDGAVVFKVSNPTDPKVPASYMVVDRNKGVAVSAGLHAPIEYNFEDQSGFFMPSSKRVRGNQGGSLGRAPCTLATVGVGEADDVYTCASDGKTFEVKHSRTASKVVVSKLAAGVPPVPPTPEVPELACTTAKNPKAAAHKAKMKAVADATFESTRLDKPQPGSLIDASRVINHRKELMEKVGKSIKHGGFTYTFKHLEPKQDGHEFAYEVTHPNIPAQTWYVSEQPWYYDQYASGKTLEKDTFTFWKKETPFTGLTQVDVPYKTAFEDASGRSEMHSKIGLPELLDAAEKTRESEANDAGRIKAYDLPKGKIGYIALMDNSVNTRKPDPITAGSHDSLKFFPAIMGDQKREFVTPGGGCDEVFYPTTARGPQSPVELLKAQVRKLREAGIKTVYLNLGGHGNSQGVYFEVPENTPGALDYGDKWLTSLSPDDLKAVFDEFKDTDFVVSTIACHGGGFGEMLKDYEDNRDGRVTVFLQSKGYGVSQEGRLFEEDGLPVTTDPTGKKFAPKAFGTYYEVFLHHYLSAGKPYGEAHYLADIETKKRIPVDSEVWRSGKKGATSTREIKKGTRK